MKLSFFNSLIKSSSLDKKKAFKLCVKLLNSSILNKKLGLAFSANNTSTRVLREIALSVLFIQKEEAMRDSDNFSHYR